MDQNYRKIRLNGTCGSSCSCYYCHLLNYASSSEGEDLLMDDVAAVYGSGSATSGKLHPTRGNLSLSQSKRRPKRRRFQRYFNQINHLRHCGDIGIPEDEQMLAEDCFSCSRNVSESSEVESDCDLETSQPILQGVPIVVRDFERLLYETRTKAFSDTIIDAIVDGAHALALGTSKILTVCRRLIAHAVSRRRRIVGPESDCADADDWDWDRHWANNAEGVELSSIKVIRNRGCPPFIKDWSRKFCD